MSITNKLTAGLVSTAVIFSVALAPTALVADEVDSLEEAFNMLKEFEVELAALSSGSGSSVCPYTWTRNLSKGSTGDDVRQLQRFLNGNPQTMVATSGAGSPGNESSYYGPATARAVSTFQELHASVILAPLGLTKGTGGFYSSTRNQANSLCQSGSGGNIGGFTGPRTREPVVQVSGDALAVTPGGQIGDGYAVLGAQRVPYTSFVLTAGNDDVRLAGVRVKKFGLSDADNFGTVALVDTNGVQIGSARSLNSRDEARLGGNFVIPRNRSVNLVVVGNIDTLGSGSGIAGLEIIGVDADARVQGRFPMRGAAHAFSDAVTLQTVEVSASKGESEIPLNEDTEVASFEFQLDAGSADEEDSYLKSVIFEQLGSADEREIGDVTVFVEDDRADYNLVVNNDQYIVTFHGRGVLIEEGDSAEVSIEVNTDEGSGERIQFSIDDESDVYVVGDSFGYGLPVTFEDNEVSNPPVADASTIQAGNIESGGRLRSNEFDDEVQYGEDVVIAAHAVEFEGEDVDMQGLTFVVTMDRFGWTDANDNNWVDADEDSVTFDNIRLVVDREVVAFGELLDSNGDQAEFDEPVNSNAISLEIEFDDDFTIDVRDNREVIFEIVANLDSAWSSFDGTSLDFKLVDVEMAEGRSSEEDYTASGGYFHDIDDRGSLDGTPIDFEGVEVIGNEVAFDITNAGVDESQFVAGTDDIVFGALEVDASDAIDDVILKDLWVRFQVTGVADTSLRPNLSHLKNCAVYDEDDDEVAEARDSLSGGASGENSTVKDQIRFRFDSNVAVDGGDEKDFYVRCNLDDDAVSGAGYTLIAISAAGDLSAMGSTSKDRLEYEINDDDFVEDLEGSSDKISVSGAGNLIVTVHHPDDDHALFAQAVGSGGSNDIQVVEIELEAEKEDIRITDIWLAGLQISNTSLESTDLDTSLGTEDEEEKLELIIESATIGLGSTTARPRDFDDTENFGGTTYINLLPFDKVNEVIEVGSSAAETFHLTFDLAGITESKGKSGQWLEGTNLVIEWEGVTSDSEGVTVESLVNSFTEVRVFPTAPLVSADSKDQTISSNGEDRKLYEFSIQADDEDDVYLKKVSLNFSTSGNVNVDDVVVRRGTHSTSPSLLGDNVDVDGAGGDNTSKKKEFIFANVEEIKAGKTVTYSVYAKVGGLGDNESISVHLVADTIASTAATSIGREYAANIGDFVWSPDSLGNREDTSSSNADWFDGYAVFTDDDVGSWTTSL